MRVCVTGGAGFIGSYLVERLVKEGYFVTVIDDLSNGDLVNLADVWHEIYFLKADISQPLRLNADLWYHLACYPRSRSFTDPMRDAQVNIEGIINVLENARRTNSKVIFSSNSGIYNCAAENLPIDEFTPDDPKTPYDLDKQTAEHYLKLYYGTYGLPYTIFRFATVYGPRQRTTQEWKPVIAEFIDRLRRKEHVTIYWHGNQTRDFIYVTDIVDALTKAIDQGNHETMILGTGTEVSINQLYKTIAEELDIHYPPDKGPKALGDIEHMRYNSTKAQAILNWKPQTNLKQGIRQCLLTLN